MAKPRDQQSRLPGFADDSPPRKSRAKSAAAEQPSPPDTEVTPASPETAADSGKPLAPSEPAEPMATSLAPQAAEIEPATQPAVQPAATPAATPAASGSDLPAELAGRSIWVIDANSLIYQVFHAIPEMTSPKGEPVNAVYGFTRDLLYLIEVKKPDYLLVAFDLPGPTFRHELYDQYKIQRAEAPNDLVSQLPIIRRMLDALAIPALGVPSFEADDILATVARISTEAGAFCYVVTGDKDCRQLINERTQVYNIRKDQLMDAAALAADWGVRPDQVVDYQSIVGDSVDNIPGVPGIGPKGARELLATYDTLDAVLANATKVSGAKRQKMLIEFGEQALRSRKLVRLEAHVPVPIDWNAARVGGYDSQALAVLLEELGFRGLRTRALGATGGGTAAPSTSATVAAEPMSRPMAAPATDWQADYRVVDTPEKLASFVELLGQQKVISIDTETTSISPMLAELVGVSVAWQDALAWYLPVRAPAGEAVLDQSLLLEALRPVLEDPNVAKVGQNLKYDLLVLGRAGVTMRGLAFDTMIASYLLDAGERSHNLDELARRYLGHENIKISELIGTGRDQKRMDEVPVAQVAKYAAEDADVAWRLVAPLRERLEAEGLRELFDKLEMPLVDALARLEANGIRVDIARLEELSGQFGTRLAELEQTIYELGGGPFNIASPKQLQEILFTRHKLPIIKRTKTGPSTDVDVLEELALRHPLPAKIIEYRQYAKLKNTYVDALPALVHPATKRVHASFNQVVAATGRLSSSDPNLQNIPIRMQSGRDIRSAFLPADDDWLLLAADYSQIELRVLAHYSGDTTLLEAFTRDDDIHALVASQVYHVPLAEVTSEQRRNAKAVNFGVIYGQSPFGLARQLGISQDEAAAFIDSYFGKYPGVEEFLAQVLAECRVNGYVKTILGRRRAISGVRSHAGRQRNLPERTAINTVIQGSAADLIKLAMLAVHRNLEQGDLQARMLLQIHDELVFEHPSSEKERLVGLVVTEMSGVLPLQVPLKVDLQSGRNWADVQPL